MGCVPIFDGDFHSLGIFPHWGGARWAPGGHEEPGLGQDSDSFRGSLVTRAPFLPLRLDVGKEPSHECWRRGQRPFIGRVCHPKLGISFGTSYVMVATGRDSLSQRGFLRLVTNQILSILGPSALEDGANQLTRLGL